MENVEKEKRELEKEREELREKLKEAEEEVERWEKRNEEMQVERLEERKVEEEVEEVLKEKKSFVSALRELIKSKETSFENSQGFTTNQSCSSVINDSPL